MTRPGDRGPPPPAAAHVASPRARDHAKEAAGEQKHDDKGDCRDDEGREIAQRAKRLAHRDQEDGAKHGAKNGAPAAEHGANDHLDADRHVDQCADRGGAEIKHQQRAGEAGKEGADDERGELVLDDVEAERGGLDGILAARLQDQARPASATTRKARAAHAMNPSAIS